MLEQRRMGGGGPPNTPSLGPYVPAPILPLSLTGLCSTLPSQSLILFSQPWMMPLHVGYGPSSGAHQLQNDSLAPTQSRSHHEYIRLESCGMTGPPRSRERFQPIADRNINIYKEKQQNQRNGVQLRRGK